MDPLSDILVLVQPRTYATGGFSAGGDWGVRFPAHGMVKCYSVVRGECWLAVDNIAEPIRLQTGSCFLLPRGWPFSLSSEPSQPLKSWEMLSQQERYNGILPLTPGENFLILGSHFRLEGDARFLLDALPPVVLLESEEQRQSLRWAVDRLLREMRDPQPGGTLIAQQIAYTMLVEALRLHVAEDIGKDPGWLAALGDVRLRAALSSIHGEPARAWTLAGLAHAAGMSRTAFAQLFKQKVGKSPMEYLTHWRMTIAANRLKNPKESISSIAPAVGYQSESAFSAAFKREWGSSPREYSRAKCAVGPS
jgi:AraC-like DNA-binding protein